METEPGSLITIIHHLRTIVSQIRPQGDISFGEFCVMTIIKKEQMNSGQKLTPTSLNIMLGTKKPATSRMLAVIEKKGYVERINDEKDHRICYLELTQEGEKILEMEKESFHQLMSRISARLGKEEIEQITKMLCHLSSILEEEQEAATKM